MRAFCILSVNQLRYNHKSVLLKDESATINWIFDLGLKNQNDASIGVYVSFHNSICRTSQKVEKMFPLDVWSRLLSALLGMKNTLIVTKTKSMMVLIYHNVMEERIHVSVFQLKIRS